MSYNATTIDILFKLRWSEPEYPNCELTHYSIYITGEIEGKVTLPPNKREYEFQQNVKLKNGGIYGTKAIGDNDNFRINIFQFQISADSTKENLTGEPSFYTANLNDVNEVKDDANGLSLLNNIFFQPVPEVLIYDQSDQNIKLLDL